ASRWLRAWSDSACRWRLRHTWYPSQAAYPASRKISKSPLRTSQSVGCMEVNPSARFGGSSFQVQVSGIQGTLFVQRQAPGPEQPGIDMAADPVIHRLLVLDHVQQTTQMTPQIGSHRQIEVLRPVGRYREMPVRHAGGQPHAVQIHLILHATN